MFKAWFFTFFIIFFQISAYTEPYNPNAQKKYSVISLSSALIDHFFVITEKQLHLVTKEKGNWAPIDYPTLRLILDHNPGASKMVTGGCGANVMKGLTELGEQCAIIGKVGSDDKGVLFIKKMKEHGIGTFLEKGTLPTGQTICLVTPDANRTSRTYFGASYNIANLTIDPEIFRSAKLFHIEGHQLLDQDLLLRALKLAKDNNVKVSMTLTNTELVRQNKTFIFEILNNEEVDIIFCNEKEAKELFGLPAKEACSQLSKMVEVAVVTMSQRGAWAQQGSIQSYQPAMMVEAIDRTGARDLYACGFLYGYLQGESLRKCNWLGILISSYVVKRLGAEIPKPIWKEIHQRILVEGKVFDHL